ncbi:MAG: class F sortase, partial [Candidatus Pacebacteria bacterium]|nr:class F sortase [Candidatus Paceibacterota bacterium]
VTSSGNMSTPHNFTDVGWYKYGTAPGMTGSAVIAGHLDNGFSLAGVFEHLADLKPGDDVSIVTADNKLLHFTVIESDTYPYQVVPLQRIFNQSDGSYLNLITCQGQWTADYTTYDHRLVVYTKLAS